MNIYVANKNFETLYAPDKFSSFIWTDRFSEAGDFEIVTQPSVENIEIFQTDYFLINTDSEHIMVIETVEIDSSSKDGDKMIVTGRSLESVLDRRIVWKTRTFVAGKVIQAMIKDLLTPAFMDKKNFPKRYWDKFDFLENDELKKEPKLREDKEADSYGAQYTGDELYSIITKLCTTYKLGMKLIPDNNKFIFSLYTGVDRSYANTSGNSYVVFSPSYNNVISSNYIESVKPLKNACLVGGEGEGSSKKYSEVVAGDHTGLDRRELYEAAGNVSSEVNGNKISDDKYYKLLSQHGKEELSKDKYQIKKTFEGEMNTKELFVYGEDFFLGDIVQIADGYGHENRARISEIVFSYTTSDGYTVYPSFKVLDNVDDVEEE